jgi:DNA-binding MarR family transcriptional regulator
MSSKPFKFDDANDSAGFLLWKMTALWQQELNQRLALYELTQTQYAILASLRWLQMTKAGSITQTALVEHSKVDKMTLSKAIRKLEAKEVVYRFSSAVDHRAVCVDFTDSGNALIEQAIVTVENADEVFFSGLSTDDLSRFKHLMIQVIATSV